MADIRLADSLVNWKGDSFGTGQVALTNADGGPALHLKGTPYTPSGDGTLLIGGVNDSLHRPVRLDRSGGVSTAKYTPFIDYYLYTAALMPTWLATTTTMTITHSTTAGSLLNASAIGTSSTVATLYSMQTVPKTSRAPLFARYRARLIKGGTNGVGEIGLTTTQSLGSSANPNGFFFSYGADGSLRPTVVFNNTVTTGTDFAASIDSTSYYTWEMLIDDNSANFIVQNSTTGAIVSDQTIAIGPDAGRFGLLPYFFAYARSYVGGTLNAGAATQIYIGDISVGLLDVEANKPWTHSMAGIGKGGIVNPTVALSQLANYTNSAAPASATLSNTTGGYTTLGGQYQFAAPVGAETDYALFAFTCPTGVKLYVTGITIDSVNTGAAVATTETWLQWFLGPDAAGATLASGSYRIGLGNQVFPVGAAIGAQAATINQEFHTPLVTNSGRVFHVGLKLPRGTATASQIIRGLVNIRGYFE